MPPFYFVAKEALHYARLDPSSIQHWQKSIHKAPLLPRLQVGLERDLRNGLNLNLEDSLAVNSSGITVGPQKGAQAFDQNKTLNFDVKLIWYLDELLFSEKDLSISQEARYLAVERERLLESVRQNYFEYLKTKDSFEKNKAAAALDSLTGGWFSVQTGKAS